MNSYPNITATHIGGTPARPVPMITGLDWQRDAICREADPEAFFPEKGGSTLPAKRLCATCPVINECLEYALAQDERFGIFGGKSERERRKIKKAREQEAAA